MEFFNRLAKTTPVDADSMLLVDSAASNVDKLITWANIKTAIFNAAATLTNKRVTRRTGSVPSSATPTINTDSVDFYSITALAENITSFTTNLTGTPTEGQTLWIAITDNGTARAITWGASFEGSLPTTTVISTRLDVGLVWNTVTSKWRCVVAASIGDYQLLDADLTTIAGLLATTDNFIQSKSSAWASRTIAQVIADFVGTGLTADMLGFRQIPQNSQSAAYTLVAADSGKHILHPSADTTARTWTIPANSSVAFPVGTAITFINQNAGGVITIAITTDTMRLSSAGTTGSRTLAANGVATAIKITSTEWIISGTGLT